MNSKLKLGLNANNNNSNGLLNQPAYLNNVNTNYLLQRNQVVVTHKDFVINANNTGIYNLKL